MTESGHPLSDYRVLDLSSGIAGAYCTKLLADAGADVIKAESPEGDHLRRRAPEGVVLEPSEDGALFSFLAGSKRALVADPEIDDDIALVEQLIDRSDAVVWSPGSRLADHPRLSPAAIRKRAPWATVTSITPWGLEGRWSTRPATEATMQALAGGPMHRGDPNLPPMVQGGRIGDWETGLTAAIGHLVSRWRTVTTGVGELVDVSQLEATILSMTMYSVSYGGIADRPFRLNRLSNLPSIHKAKDGYVGFMVVTGQQWLDFCVLVERFDWLEDESLIRFDVRHALSDQLVPIIDAWVVERTCDEVIELATMLRIPVARVENGETAPQADHFVARKEFVTNPRDGFVQPDVPYTLGAGEGRRAPMPAPRLGEHSDELRAEAADPASVRELAVREDDGVMPFEGLRIADFTGNWAGPVVSHVLALFGAEVIHVESVLRPDNMRMNPIVPMTEDNWWELSPLFHGPNSNKLGLTLEMTTPRGQELARELIAASDILIENNSPRVFENWGLDYDEVRKLNPSIVMLRAPAFGLSGPWRDRTGYAQTMEMASGLAWMTGAADHPPEIPNGPMDPIAGGHATVALLLAMEHRRRTGEGMKVECPMIGGALNVAAEQVIEFSAHGVLLHREGNRSPDAAPQGAYLTADVLPTTGEADRWVLISVSDDEQWQGLRQALDDPEWARDERHATHAGRRAHHDAIDEQLAAWCATRSADAIVDHLIRFGVPAAPMLLPTEPVLLDQLHDRGFLEEISHPVAGDYPVIGYPAKLSNGPSRLNRRHAPLLGGDNHDVLSRVLHLDDDEIAQLAVDGVIGDRPGGATLRW